MPRTLIAPSILASDFGHLHDAIEFINKSSADWIHCDIMDGRFVPNISFGFPVMEAVARAAQKPMDVHLMIVEPEKYIEGFAALGAASISVHVEASPHLHRTLGAIRELGEKYRHPIKAGVAINPGTPVQALEDILHLTDLVCMMSVNPGFGGQKFIERTIVRVQELKAMIEAEEASTLIEIDGGVSMANAARLIEAGADVLVAGSSVFRAEDPFEAVNALRVAR